MQFADYNNAKENLNSECLRLLKQEFISKEEYENLDKDKLIKFFNSELFYMICSADKIHKEYRFIYPLSISQLGYQNLTDDKIIIQGIADCVIENKNEIIVIDYKTDKIKTLTTLYERYHDQLLIYQQALSKIFNKPSNTAILYSFYLNKNYIIKNNVN